MQLPKSQLQLSIFISALNPTQYILLQPLQLLTSMKNPFLNHNDIFEKIDHKKPNTTHTLNHTSTFEKINTTNHNYYHKNNNQNINQKVYSPLIAANYSQKTLHEHIPLSPVDYTFNRTDQNDSTPSFSYNKQILTDYKNTTAPYQTTYKEQYSSYQSTNKPTYKPLDQGYTYDNNVSVYNDDARLNADKIGDSSYFSYKYPDKKELQSNSAYISTTSNTIDYKNTFDNLDMKNSAFEINKMDHDLTKLLSSRQNIAEITRIFGLNTKTGFIEKQQDSVAKSSMYSQPQPAKKQYQKTPITNIPISNYSDFRQKQIVDQSPSYQPFLVVGEQDEDFNQEEEQCTRPEVFNCSFMSMTSKNKGPLFRVSDASNGLQFSLKKQLMKEINLKCCRNDVRVILTTNEKIRVKKCKL